VAREGDDKKPFFPFEGERFLFSAGEQDAEQCEQKNKKDLDIMGRKA